MKKQDLIRSLGVSLREVTPEDRACARTDYQISSRYILVRRDGREYFCGKGTIKEILECSSL